MFEKTAQPAVEKSKSTRGLAISTYCLLTQPKDFAKMKLSKARQKT